MSIKNYTTTISPGKTVGEIQQMLAKQKARAILIEYNDDADPIAISFKIQTRHGLVPYRLPANVEGIFGRIYRDKGIPRSKKTKEQAMRVAWRIIKDWVDAQLAIIESEMVTLEEVFLPYAQTPSGKTVYELFNESPDKLHLTN